MCYVYNDTRTWCSMGPNKFLLINAPLNPVHVQVSKLIFVLAYISNVSLLLWKLYVHSSIIQCVLRVQLHAVSGGAL